MNRIRTALALLPLLSIAAHLPAPPATSLVGTAAAADIEATEVICPVSGHSFFGLEIRAVNTLKHRDGDFLLRAEGGNQYATWVWTCPFCFFSARPDAFLYGAEVDFDPSSIETMELNQETRESDRVQLLIPPGLKYRNATAYYFSIGEPPYELGVLQLHASWAVRMSTVSMPKGPLGTWWKSYLKITEEGDYTSEETQLLAIAEDLREKLRGADDPGKRIELMYILASTLRRAGEHKQAVPILKELFSIPEIGEIRPAAAQELDLAITEAAFQKQAVRYFMEAVQLKETLPNDKLQSIYLIGELSRRLGMYDQAKAWFEKSEENPMPQRWARNIFQRQKLRLANDIASD